MVAFSFSFHITVAVTSENIADVVRPYLRLSRTVELLSGYLLLGFIITKTLSI